MRLFKSLAGALLLSCSEVNLRPLPDEESGSQSPASTLPSTVPACPPRCPKVLPSLRLSRPSPLPAENALPGEPRWKDGRIAGLGQLELYVSSDSVEAGDRLAVKVSSGRAAQAELLVYRIGYYGGAGARLVWSSGPVAVGPQAACPRDPATGLIECQWTDTVSFEIGADWVSGLYLVKGLRDDGFRRFAPFVVRDGRAAEILFQPAFTTSQAYNRWGGTSLYEDVHGGLPNNRAVQVSFDRPYEQGEGAGFTPQWELPLVQLLEREGYDVTYATNFDFARFGDLLSGIGAFVHGGHDEYWLSEQRAAIDAALASGHMSLAYFGANGGYWRVRGLPSSSGQPLRIMACYKGIAGDPQPGSTVRFRDPPGEQPENGLFGSMYESWMLIPFPLTVKDPSHWLYEGTGLRAGQMLHGLVGNEYDRIFDNGYSPPGLSVSAEGPVLNADGIPGIAQVVDRTLPSGRLVFSAGTFYWALALGQIPALADSRVERMTINVIDRALTHRRTTPWRGPVTGALQKHNSPNAIWAANVAHLAGTVGASGWIDGPGAQARFDGPTGLAVTPQSQVIVAESAGNRIRLVENDAARTVITLAGNGQLGLRDGPGAQAMFRTPTGVAVGADGAIYVADSDNHVIRRVEKTPPYNVSTYAGSTRTQGDTDGPAASAQFRRPTALTFDSVGHLYVADQNGHRIRKIEAGTRVVSTIAGHRWGGHMDDPDGSQALFNNPTAIAAGSGGELYVFDAGNGLLRRVSTSPPYSVTTIAGGPPMEFGFADGAGNHARFRAQFGLATGLAGELLVADTANYRVRKILPGVDALATQVFTIAGSGEQGTDLGGGEVADLVAPSGIAVGLDGRIYVSDSYNQSLRVITR